MCYIGGPRSQVPRSRWIRRSLSGREPIMGKLDVGVFLTSSLVINMVTEYCELTFLRAITTV